MTTTSPFTPGQSLKVTAGSATASTALPTNFTGNQIEVQAIGTNPAAIAFGTAAVAATVATTSWAASNYPVINGQSKIITVPATATHVAYIRDGAADVTLYFTLGYGN